MFMTLSWQNVMLRRLVLKEEKEKCKTVITCLCNLLDIGISYVTYSAPPMHFYF